MPDLMKYKNVSFDPDQWKEITNYRHAHRMPSKMQAIRKLIELGLKASAPPLTDEEREEVQSLIKGGPWWYELLDEALLLELNTNTPCDDAEEEARDEMLEQALLEERATGKFELWSLTFTPGGMFITEALGLGHALQKAWEVNPNLRHRMAYHYVCEDKIGEEFQDHFLSQEEAKALVRSLIN